MKNKMHVAPTQKVPTANIAVNKGRIKLYTKNVEIPTYYLQDKQEFQIELFNPTTNVVLAKISLNNKLLSQGGLVLGPGQRVFLDRYLDVAKKFMFDTYEVSNTNEVKVAIENNGDIKVQFFKEIEIIPFGNPILINDYKRTIFGGPNYNYGTNNYGQGTLGLQNIGTTTNLIQSSTNNCYYSNSVNYSDTNSKATLDYFSDDEPVKNVRSKLSKKIETGRVEKGSDSDQTFKTVNKDFEYFAFHVVEYKILPLSQKINTVEDLQIKRYCTNCGSKLGKTDKFCAKCGTKA
jgi:hypothetical protein